MTRRGSIAYYLAAIVCGCLFLVLGLTAVAEPSLRFSGAGLRDFFLLYFLALAYGWFGALVFAFLLRRVTSALRWTQAWHWAALGGVLCPVLILGLAYLWAEGISKVTPALPLGIERVLFGGPVAVVAFATSIVAAIVSAAAAGIATGLVLQRIHRAFEERT